MSSSKPPLFVPALKTKTVRAEPGQPELTMGQREEHDRPTIEAVSTAIEELKAVGYPYRKARTRAIQRAAEALHRDPSVIAKTWRRWEAAYLVIGKMKRENERVIKALATLRAENQGKESAE